MIDREKMAATTEDDIVRHALEDGEPGDGALAEGVLVVPATRLRQRLGMSQAIFAEAIGVPLETVRNWEQERMPPDPAARTLLALVAADPRHVLGLLGWAEREDLPEVAIERQPSNTRPSIARWVRRDAASQTATTAKRRA